MMMMMMMMIIIIIIVAFTTATTLSCTGPEYSWKWKTSITVVIRFPQMVWSTRAVSAQFCHEPTRLQTSCELRSIDNCLLTVCGCMKTTSKEITTEFQLMIWLPTDYNSNCWHSPSVSSSIHSSDSIESALTARFSLILCMSWDKRTIGRAFRSAVLFWKWIVE